jgi:hypothetical protein
VPSATLDADEKAFHDHEYYGNLQAQELATELVQSGGRYRKCRPA